MNYFLIFCSGFTFAIVFINLAIGIFNKRFGLSLYFGFSSILAGIFLLAQILALYNVDYSTPSGIISLIKACTYYSLIVWLSGEFTNYKHVRIQIGLTAFIAMFLASYLLFAKLLEVDWIWSILAQLLVFSIGIYGFIAGPKDKNQISVAFGIEFRLCLRSKKARYVAQHP